MTKITIPEPTEETEDDGQKFFYISAIVVYYKSETGVAQRHMNVLMEEKNGNITQGHLAHLQTVAVERVKVENNVVFENILDIVILNITMLGLMTDEEFNPTKAEESPAEPATLNAF